MTTFDSLELVSLAEYIPVAAAGKGLLFVVDATFTKEADIELDVASVTLDTALAIAAAANAPFVSLNESRFNRELLRAVMSEDEELSRKVDRVLAGASDYEGEMEKLTLQWPAHGLIFEWTAEADWHERLWEMLAEARNAESQESDEEMAEWQKVHNASVKKFEAKLTASREYRGASIQNRRAIAESIAGNISDDLIDSWGGRTAMTEVGRAAKRAAYEYEQIFYSQLPDLIAELIARDDWPGATTVIAMRDLTLKFLMEKADGYRLGTAFVEEVVQLARRSKR